MDKHQFLSARLRPSLLTITILSALQVQADELADNVKKSDIEVIQVSAQHRVENIQDVPIAISAFSDDSLEKLNAENINDLGLFTPGLETNNATATQTTFNIRGITTNDFGIGLDPAVAVYIDGVYVGRRGTSNLNFNDIARVEVLKGPQGTLFGRNSAAGAINIITKLPEEENTGSLQLTAGNYGKLKAATTYNLALSDDLFWRVSGVKNHRDGYVDVIHQQEDIGDNNDWSLTSSLLWQASPNLTANLRFDVSNIDQDSRPAATLNPAFGPGDPFGSVATDVEDNNEKRKAKGASLELNYDFANMRFTSISAYREFTRYNSMEDDGSAFDRAYFHSILDEDQQQLSQEFRLTGYSDKLKWTLGATYFDEDISQDTYANFLFQSIDGFALTSAGMNPAEIPNVMPGLGMAGFFMQLLPPQLINEIASQTVFTPEQIYGVIAFNNYGKPFNELTRNRNQTTSYAAYADATYSVNEQFNLTLGLRYSVDKKTFNINTAYQNEINIGLLDYPGIPVGFAFANPTDSEQKDDWSKLTPRIVVDYQWTDDLMTYASYAEGFKSGGFNTLGMAPPVAEETVKNSELGMKSFWLDGDLKLNLSVFSYQYTDLQQHELDGPAGTIPTYNLRNVDAEGRGYEIEAEWQASDNLLLSVNYGLLDTEYTHWGLFPWENEQDLNESKVGESISGMPKHNIYLAADYYHYWSQHTLAVHLDHTYTSERQTDIDGPSIPVLPYDPATVKGLTADNRIDAYGITNAHISVIDNDENYRVSFYVENLFDKEYLLAIGGQAMAVGSPIANRGLPRMYGVSVTMNF